ncbi:hypothetical protein BEP19_10000 [Ammoniphilus oxalaticus]|uniref:Uncharacterized protein n=1 Tax=Ammoniphilus oxalaticus TaxID=66863 RepID=A0A419SFM2_9BACL|nr:hypothetical protein [Ammoniphilus oxalaticus]RKD22584.1 hypothetical protein BEP19_10000 [Ammoniphilus oxalaticus]
MLKRIDPEKFALSVVSSSSAISDSPEAIAKEKVEIYVASYKEAEDYNRTVVKANRLEDHKKFYGEK